MAGDKAGFIKIRFSYLVPVRKFHFEVDKGPIRQSHVKQHETNISG